MMNSLLFIAGRQRMGYEINHMGLLPAFIGGARQAAWEKDTDFNLP
jgi:hypothetical protein